MNQSSPISADKRPTSLLLAALIVALLQGCTEQSSKPNILIIMLDDFGYNDLAINNGSDSPTPALDNIARGGMRFTRHYTESSCSPTRAALLTGMYPARLGFHPAGSGIAHEVDTLPDVLAANGYSTHMIGKWHTGDAHQEARPEYQGFQQWFGFMSQIYLAGPDSKGNYRRARPTYNNPWLETEAGQLQQYKGHLTDILTDKALQVISREKQPWLMYLAYYAPHTPVQPASRFAKRFEDSKRGRYQALKAQVDASMEKIRKQLATNGELENTIFIVLGDNGGTAADYPSNLPFTGKKTIYSEGGVRTPLLMSWPGQWSELQVVNETVSVLDLFPTLLAALNIDAPKNLDGVNILKPVPQRRLYWYGHGMYGDRFSVLSANGQWRLNQFFGQPLQLTAEANFTVKNARNDLALAPEVGQRLTQSFQQWLDAATISRLQADQRSSVSQSYVRDAFRRTPLIYTHTLGIGFRVNQTERASAPRQPLVYQKGYLNYDYNPITEQLNVTLDGQKAEIKIALRPNACHSLVVTSNLLKNNMVIFNAKSRSTQAIYVDGKLLSQRSYSNPILNKASPQNALVINTDKQSAAYMPAASQPVLSTRVLSNDMINAKLHPELLAECENRQI